MDYSIVTVSIAGGSATVKRKFAEFRGSVFHRQLARPTPITQPTGGNSAIIRVRCGLPAAPAFRLEVVLVPKYIEELVSRQVHRSQLARQEEAERGKDCHGMVIAISRSMGSGARIIAGKLAGDLGWSLWDKELIDTIAKDASVSRKVVEKFDEHTISEIELLARAALGDHEMGDFLYSKHLARAIAAIGKLGNAIILGRGGTFILPDALSIRIDASFDVRVRNMMSFENLTHDEAAAKIRQSDRDREHFLESTFGKDRAHTAHYDLTIWMDRFTNDDAVRIIKTAIDARCKSLAG